ncbi:hypothetical protein [Enterobacter bugandensis]|uniref:hypothetical protein n=1 Tax=Enterobacter bugandensis TaxID=881260 RepID=UPI002FD0570F
MMKNVDAKKYEGIKYCLTDPGRGAGSNFTVRNQWEEYCSRMQIPCIVIKPQGKGMKVHFDYVTYDDALDAIFVGSAEEVLRKRILELLKVYSQCTSCVMECTALGMVTTVTGVPPELAPAMAVELYDIIALFVMKELTDSYRRCSA